MPCKLGTRDSIEASKRYYEELKKYDPIRELWKSLVDRVHQSAVGYEGLSSDERLYFAVTLLEGEVYNGGMDQYFWNHSGSMYCDALNGLETLKAEKSRALLLRAKELLFGNTNPPTETTVRRTALNDLRNSESTHLFNGADELAEVDREFCKDPDGLIDRLTAFAEAKGLVTPFKPQEH